QHIGRHAAYNRQHVRGLARFADDAKIRPRLEEAAQPIARDRVLVGDDDANEADVGSGPSRRFFPWLHAALAYRLKHILKRHSGGNSSVARVRTAMPTPGLGMRLGLGCRIA